MIKLKLKMGEIVQETQGSTLESAINKFDKPDVIKARGNMEIEKDGKHVVTTPMSVLRLKMMFNKKHAFKQLFIKNLSLFLK